MNSKFYNKGTKLFSSACTGAYYTEGGCYYPPDRLQPVPPHNSNTKNYML